MTHLSYSRRVAAWLFALLAPFLQACAHALLHRLEMISVWLLFLKLLRATAGVKRANENEIQDSEEEPLNQQEKEQEHLSETVAMETSQHSELADLTDCKMDLEDSREEKYQQEEEEEVEERCDAYFSESLDTVKSSSPVAEELRSDEVKEQSSDIREDFTVKQAEDQNEELNLRQSPALECPEPDSDHQVKEQLENKEASNTTAVDADGMEYQEHEDKTENHEHLDGPEDQKHQKGTEYYKHQDRPEYQETLEGTDYEEHQNVTEYQEHLDGTDDQEHQNGTEYQEYQDETENQELQESQKVEEEKSVLEQQINELAISDASTESCHDNDRDDLSDCLQVEMAIVSSDSDVEEQWKVMFSPVEDTEEMDDILASGQIASADINEEMSSQDHATEEDGITLSESNVEPDDDTRLLTTGSVGDVLEQPECPTECELEDISYEAALHYGSLTKIAEDEEELGQKHSLQRLSASTSELDKRLPPDYCVIQEMKNENISTEHLDFQSARQQWQKMEEQNKGRQPSSLRQGNLKGGQNFMYTPVRKLERSTRDPDSDGLSLGDYQHTQFSPCSEDSGLDDTSYRSPYDEPETPVEREIRETMEREENFRRERAMSRSSSGDLGPGKTRPVTLLTSKSDGEDRRKVFNTPEDRCRSLRSPSSQTPTFSIMTSPSLSSRPAFHEMVANNVIILEPESYPASPMHRGKGVNSPGTSRFQELPSNMSNVIVLETSNLIIRSASEFCLSSLCQETQESTFHNNPFFKLRSQSTMSLVDQEIKVVRQRDEEFRRQRAQLYAKERYDTVLVSPSLLDTFSFDGQGQIPAKCKSSPSSPLKSRKMDRSVLSCDHKFPKAPSAGVRRKSALAQRWEAGIFANHQHD